MKRLGWMAGAAFAVAAAAAGCKSERIERVDADRDVLIDDQWNDTDLNQVANKMVQSMLAHDVVAKAAEKPTIMVGTIANRTNEHIDVKALSDKIVTGLLQSGKVRAIDETARGELAKEYEFQASGNVDAKTRKGPGKQRGMDHLLRGDIAYQEHEAEGTKSKWYKVTMKLTNVETNEIEWQDEDRIKKVKAKSSVRF